MRHESISSLSSSGVSRETLLSACVCHGFYLKETRKTSGVSNLVLKQSPFIVYKLRREIICNLIKGHPKIIDLFNNSAAILNFEHIAMHCGLSRVILLF